MASHFRRCVASCLTVLALPAQLSHACINITREPPRPDIVESFDTAGALFDSDSGALPIAVGQRIEIRLPVLVSGEQWRASIAAGMPSSGISLEQTPARTDEDGIRRQGVVLKGLSKGDTIVLLEHIAPATRTATAVRKDKKKSATDASVRRVRMMYLRVEELQTRIEPPQPHPLILTADDAGKPLHVTNGEDIIVTLPLPERQDGAWRIAASTADAVPSYAKLMRASERVDTGGMQAQRFVLSSTALTGPLSFEFVPAAPGTTRSLRFDIQVYPAPTC